MNIKFKIKSTPVYNKWYSKIKNEELKFKIFGRLKNIQAGNFGDFKNVGDGVFELRFMVCGGIRIYYTFKNNIIVLLLNGGNKSTQKEDIKKAKQIAGEV